MTSALRVMSNGCHVDRRILGWMRVLLVEDHATLADRIAQGLRQAGMAVDAVSDGEAAVEAAAQTAYDVTCSTVTTDRARRPGVPEARRFRPADPHAHRGGSGRGSGGWPGAGRGPTPSASRSSSPSSSLALRALSRRAPSAPPSCAAATSPSTAHGTARAAARERCLTRKEFGILETLLAADGALVSAEELLEHVWDADVDSFSNIVSVTMTRLRRKLAIHR